MPAYPAPCLHSTAHFSVADFFRDCPWLNVPPHRKADILVEPLCPRLGLLGGAPESGGKVSKLAALAAARKKKEGEKNAATPVAVPPSNPQLEKTEVPLPELRGTPLSIRDRLAANNAKSPKPAEENASLQRLSKPGLPTSSLARKPSPDKSQPAAPSMPPPVPGTEVPSEKELDDQKPKIDIRASPSTFASTIVGTTAIPTPEPSHLHSNSVDLLRIYGQNHAEPFDFADPSPDDVVLNAQNTAKGLAFRSKVGTTA